MEALESRLAALEHSLGGLSTRVTCIEGRKGDDASTIGSSHQSASTFTPENLGEDDDEYGRASIQDPTEVIGSIVFTKEEDFGFFGKYTLPQSFLDDLLGLTCSAYPHTKALPPTLRLHDKSFEPRQQLSRL